MKSTLVLGLDTSSAALGVALAERTPQGDQLVAEVTLNKGRAEDLLMLVDELFRLSQRDRKNPAGIAVVTGPGSFTGLRSGITVARNLAQVLECPVLPLSTAELFLLAAPAGQLVAVVQSLGKGEYYVALGRISQTGDLPVPEYQIPPHTSPLPSVQEALSDLQEPFWLMGDAIWDTLPRLARLFPLPVTPARPGIVALWGVRALASGRGENYLDVQPFYGREPVYRKLEEGS